MKNEDFHKDEFYDAYVLGRLSADDEDLFEEHLLFCEHCRNEIEVREVSVAASGRGENISKETTMERKLSTKTIIIRLSIAASVIIIAGYSLYVILNPAGDKTLVEQDSSMEEIPASPDVINDTSLIAEPEFQPETEQPSEFLLAEAFKPSPMFENAIENQVRSDGLSVLSPSNAQTFAPVDMIEFRWENGEKQLSLVIYNNKGGLIYEKEVKSPFTLNQTLQPGLYYWQLETEDEALSTLKFLIK